MSTNATVSIVNEDGSVYTIYNHWDGYPSSLGITLRNYYKSENRVRDLIGMGDASIIARKISPSDPANHNFTNHEKGVCLFYSRDRGEDDCEYHVFDNILQMLKEFGQQFNYIYRDKKWFCCKDYTNESMILLTIDEAIEKEED